MSKKKRVTTKFVTTKEAKALLKKKGVTVLGYKQGNRYLTSVALTEKAKINSMKISKKYGTTTSNMINMILEDLG